MALASSRTRTYDIVSNPPPSMIGFVYWRFGPEPTEAKIETPTTLSPAAGPRELP